jgi:magnesium-protoporphyrin O-methyltransferase
LLDVGGGIGVIGLELQAEGIRQVSLVEAAPSYLAVAEKEFARTQGAAEFSAYLGDFVDVPAALAADVVTLDRVVCCYPDYQRLLRRAAESTRNILVLSFPRDRWFVRLGVGVENLLRWIRRRNFRTFVHPAAEIASTLGHSGLQRKARRNTLTWCVERWTRPRPE